MTTKSNLISGTFAYAKVTEPSFKYQSDTEKEFTIDIVVDEETYDNFVEQYPKQKGKIIKTSEFEAVYKFPPVFPEEKKQFILKLKRPATFKNKETKEFQTIEQKYWPKILVKKGDKTTPLKEGVLIGNASTGKVSFEENTNDYGTFAKLKNILVETLIEYSKDGDDAANDFGLSTSIEGESDFASDGNGGNVKVPPSAKTKVAPKKPKVEEDDSEMDPF